MVIIDIIERNRINIMVFYLIVVQFQRLHQKVSNLPRYLSTNSFTQLFYSSTKQPVTDRNSIYRASTLFSHLLANLSIILSPRNLRKRSHHAPLRNPSVYTRVSTRQIVGYLYLLLYAIDQRTISNQSRLSRRYPTI